jgi:hypothetical protein
MSTRPKTKIASQLNAARLAISNTLADAEIQSLVAAYGYTAEKLAAGKQLYDTATAAVNAQTAAVAHCAGLPLKRRPPSSRHEQAIRRWRRSPARSSCMIRTIAPRSAWSAPRRRRRRRSWPPLARCLIMLSTWWRSTNGSPSTAITWRASLPSVPRSPRSTRHMAHRWPRWARRSRPRGSNWLRSPR